MKKVIFSVVFILALNSLKAGILFGGGSGTTNDPYLIYTPRQMDSVRYYLGKSFKLMNDLDLTVDYPNWPSIRNGNAWFYGSFDGNNHIVKYKNTSATGDYFGFFAVNDGTIKNLGVIAKFSVGCSWVGGLAGFNRGTITSCFSTGEVYAGSSVGGLVGRNSNRITNCYSSANVSGYSSIGGFLGTNNESSIPIVNCYSSGCVKDISSSPGYNKGGFIGYNYNYDYRSKILHCYSTGYVDAKRHVTGGSTIPGGFAGSHGYSYNTSADSAAVIDDCYYNVSTSRQSIGIGYIGNPLVVKNVYGYGTKAMQRDTSFQDFDFTNSWQIINSKTYPALRKVFNNAPFAFGERLIGLDTIELSNLLKNDYDFETGQTNLVYKIISGYNHGTIDGSEHYIFPADAGSSYKDSILYQVGELVNLDYGTDTLWGNRAIAYIANSPFAGGHGTLADPYLVATTAQMDSVRNYPDAAFKLINDLDLSSVTTNWFPIGDNETNFSGSFDGDSKTIKYTLIINTLSDEVFSEGLFGINSGTIKKLNVVANIVDTAFLTVARVGGIVGINEGNIFWCSVAGEIYGEFFTGGITGTNSGTIKFSYNTANVWGNGDAGGLVGDNNSAGLVAQCYSTGNVFSASSAGGLVSVNHDGATIENSYATGAVQTYNANNQPDPESPTYYLSLYSAAGFCQVNNGIILNSYCSGAVSSNFEAGGFLGVNRGTITNAYYNINTSLQKAAIGYDYSNQNIPGLTTIGMRDSAETQMPGFNFTSIWGHYNTYPALDSISNNAPFAFGDTLTGGDSVALADVLTNDYDFETSQTNLTFKIFKVYGSGTFSSGYFKSNGIDSVLYRVGELISTTDTLWGNEAITVIYTNVELNASIKTINLGPVSNNIATFGISSNINWEISTDVNWLTIDTSESRSNINITALTNNTGASRIAYVIITGPGNCIDTVVVVQNAVGHLSSNVQVLNKIYDGTTSANASFISMGNIYAIDAITASIDEAFFEDKNAGNNKTVTVKLNYSGSNIDNYTYDSVITLTNSVISRKQLSINDLVLQNDKVYDGNTTATINSFNVSGIVTGENVLVNAQASYASKNVGTQKTITVTYTLSGTDTANYLKPDDYAANLGTIEKQTQSISWEQQFSGLKTSDDPVQLLATSDKGLPIVYSSNDLSVITVLDSRLTIVGQGSAEITASQPGNDTIAGATEITKEAAVYEANDINLTDQKIVVYPNPNNGCFYIENSEADIIAVTVFNAAGEIVYKAETLDMQNRIAVNLSEVSDGIYFVKLQTNISDKFKKIVIYH